MKWTKEKKICSHSHWLATVILKVYRIMLTDATELLLKQLALYRNHFGFVCSFFHLLFTKVMIEPRCKRTMVENTHISRGRVKNDWIKKTNLLKANIFFFNMMCHLNRILLNKEWGIVLHDMFVCFHCKNKWNYNVKL